MVGMYFYFDIYDGFEAIRELANSHNLGRFTINKLFGTDDLRVSYIVTLVASFGLLAFMGIMKKIVDKGDN
jgi:hypothetical protein